MLTRQRNKRKTKSKSRTRLQLRSNRRHSRTNKTKQKNIQLHSQRTLQNGLRNKKGKGIQNTPIDAEYSAFMQELTGHEPMSSNTPITAPQQSPNGAKAASGTMNGDEKKKDNGYHNVTPPNQSAVQAPTQEMKYGIAKPNAQIQMQMKTPNVYGMGMMAPNGMRSACPPTPETQSFIPSRSCKRTDKRRKGTQSKLGVSKDQLKRQQNAQINNSMHILNNLGKHNIHIHKQEKRFGLLRINSNISEFADLKMEDILSINGNVTLKISCIDCAGATEWSLSIDEIIAKKYNITPHSISLICRINPLSVELSQIEVTLKNQFISRRTLWKIERDLLERIVHINEHIKCNEKGYDLEIKEMQSMAKRDHEMVSCGLITHNTEFLFRSKSAYFMYLVQISKEMWDFNNQQTNFEIFIDGFLKTLLTKWKQNECNHAYSIIFFSRTYCDIYYTNRERSSRLTNMFNRDSHRRFYRYRDYYEVVVRNSSTTNWRHLRQILLQAFDIFPRRVKWEGNVNRISMASEGNLLEAIQLALNLFDTHYIDRDLHRTALSITVVTAGNGHYFVDKTLTTFTKVRILNNGINCNIVSMTHPSLHPSPLFIYGSPLAFEQNDWETLSYYRPTEMMQITFFNFSPNYDDQIFAPIIKCGLIPPQAFFTSSHSPSPLTDRYGKSHVSKIFHKYTVKVGEQLDARIRAKWCYNYNLCYDHKEIFQNYTVRLQGPNQLYNWIKFDAEYTEYCDAMENNLIPNTRSDATGNEICKFVENIKKKADRLNLHEIPISFFGTMDVQSRLANAIASNAIRFELQTVLLNKFGFMMDTYMRRDVYAIVQWHANSLSLTWVPTIESIDQAIRFRKQSWDLFTQFRKYFHQTIAKYVVISGVIQDIISQI
eukprot:879029_1